MSLYDTHKAYVVFGKFIASANVILQLTLLVLIRGIALSPGGYITAFIIAYLLTDLLNGLIHMIMDHNENYSSIYGPLVAAFHLHHQTPRYTRKPLPLIYFNESGAKIWLVPYLVFVLLALHYSLFSGFVMHVLVYIGILSSVAEVSHYLCHSSDSKVARFLAKIGLLLSREHHTPHHEQDNMNYAFLNGVSDPLINPIARRLYTGYKSTTDRHFEQYFGRGTQNRR